MAFYLACQRSVTPPLPRGCGVRHCSRRQSGAFPKLRNASSHRLLLCSRVLCEVMDSFLGEASIADIEPAGSEGGRPDREQ